MLWWFLILGVSTAVVVSVALTLYMRVRRHMKRNSTASTTRHLRLDPPTQRVCSADFKRKEKRKEKRKGTPCQEQRPTLSDSWASRLPGRWIGEGNGRSRRPS